MTIEEFNQKSGRLRKLALLVGIVGIVGAVIIGILAGMGSGLVVDKVFQPFIVSFMLCFGLSLGMLAVLLVHHLCGGAWSMLIQRSCEAGTRTLPMMMLIGAIVLLGSVWFSGVYPWTSAEYRALHHIVENKTAFLNQGFFTFAFFLYFGIWLAIMFAYNKWSENVERTGSDRNIVLMKKLAAPGLILFVITLTFAVTHWTMSLEPVWFSTIYGAWYIASYALTSISFATLVLTYTCTLSPIREVVTAKHFKDLGNFMLGFTIFWSYISFSQFLLIWCANLPEEIGFYLNRQGGSLTAITILLIVLVWLFPLFYLLMRPNKTNIHRLRFMCYWVLAMRVLDMYWYVVPSFPENHNVINWVTVLSVLLAVAGLGGIWLWAFLGHLVKRSLLPERDPRRALYLREEAQHHA